MQDGFSQDWEVYGVLTNELRLATYVELDTVCSVEDLHNMLEVIDVHNEFTAYAQKQRDAAEEQARRNQK